MSRRWTSMSRRWQNNSQECRNVDPEHHDVALFFMNRNVHSPHTVNPKNPNTTSIFADTQKTHPSLSRLVLETPKSLRMSLDSKITSDHLCLKSLLLVWLRVRVGSYSNCFEVFGVVYAREGTLGVVSDHSSHRLESRPPSQQCKLGVQQFA